MTSADAANSESTGLSQQRDFAVFYRNCRDDIVRALVLAVADRDIGLEAADEGFTRALERWDHVGCYENPEGWVYRVGLNWARSALRRRPFITGDLFGTSVAIDQLPDPDILAAVSRLPLSYRSVIVARFFLDWSIEQTANALGIPEGTVKTRQARALRRLRRRLGAPDEP